MIAFNFSMDGKISRDIITSGAGKYPAIQCIEGAGRYPAVQREKLLFLFEQFVYLIYK